jgi:hypothetical protein
VIFPFGCVAITDVLCAMPDSLTEEFEAAIRELRDLCDETVDLAERKHRLAVRKEMNRLYRLYEKLAAIESAADSGESETLAEIRSHLEPLGLAAEGTPLMELVRLAALKITEK